MSINEPVPPAAPTPATPPVTPPAEPAPDQEPLAPNPSEPEPFVDPEVTP